MDAPWYQSNMFWSPVSLAVGIVIAVVAIMKQDLRWLFVLAWPLFSLSLWWAIRGFIEPRRVVLLFTIGGALVIAGALDWLNIRLDPSRNARPTENSTTMASGQEKQPPPFREKVETITIVMGGMTASNPVEFLRKGVMVPLTVQGIQPVKVYVEGKQTYVDAAVYGGSGQPPLEIRKNEFTLRTPAGWDRNFSDAAIEVVDPSQVPVFQLIYETASRIRINGVFPYPGGIVAITNDRMAFLGPNDQPPVATRIFKYPSWKFKGVYE